MTRSEFDSCLSLSDPPDSLSLPLAALWWISNRNWGRAHDLIDSAPGSECARVHAYLHRIEGDEGNANYWYRRAGMERPDCGLSQEREILLQDFLE